MKDTWTDEGKQGRPKVYKRGSAVLRLIRRILKNDVDLLKNTKPIADLSETELFEMGETHYNIYKN